ncbi:MAG: FAD-dependent oxidoreductase [Ignavibacteriaceae bacterium]
MTKDYNALIIGAGLTGMSAAFHLKNDYAIVEKEKVVGGLVRTEQRGEYLFDYTGHWLHLRRPYIKKFVSDILGVELTKINKKSKIYSYGVFTEYPFQANLFGLPAPVVKECLMGFIETNIKRKDESCFKGNSFMDYIEYYFGHGISKHFFIPFNKKLFGVHPKDITSRWCGRFVPKPTIEEVINGTLGINNLPLGYNSSFFYPSFQGIGMISEKLKERVANLYLQTRLEKIDLNKRIAYFNNDFEIKFKYLINTSPLNHFLRCINNLPKEIEDIIPELKSTKVDYLIMGVRKKVLKGLHWIYFPEAKYPFYRIGCFSNAIPYFSPTGKSSLYVEISNDYHSERLKNKVLNSVIDLLKDFGDIESEEDIEFCEYKSIPTAYVIHDENHFDYTNRIHGYLEENDIYSIGRYGKWTYNAMEDALYEGYLISEKLKQRKTYDDRRKSGT